MDIKVMILIKFKNKKNIRRFTKKMFKWKLSKIILSTKLKLITNLNFRILNNKIRILMSKLKLTLINLKKKKI